MNASLALLAASLIVLAVAVYVFHLASRARSEAQREVRGRETDFAIEREQHASERARLIEQMAELADRPLVGSRPSQPVRESPEVAAWREAGVVAAGDQLTD
jgi:hypothetical protein